MAGGGAEAATGAGAERVDLRAAFPPVRDQGPRGTCLAFAVTAAHESTRAAGLAVAEDLAEEVLYWGCKQIDADRESGSAFLSSTAALERWGQPDEQHWPYDAARDDASASYCPPPGALDPSVCRLTRLSQIEATSDEIRRWLRRGRAVALGLWLTRGFLEGRGGAIPAPRAGEPRLEGHAVLVVGYDDAAGGSQGTLIIRNSWGPTWGDGGYGYLPYAHLELGSEAWVVDPEGAVDRGAAGGNTTYGATIGRMGTMLEERPSGR